VGGSFNGKLLGTEGGDWRGLKLKDLLKRSLFGGVGAAEGKACYALTHGEEDFSLRRDVK